MDIVQLQTFVHIHLAALSGIMAVLPKDQKGSNKLRNKKIHFVGYKNVTLRFVDQIKGILLQESCNLSHNILTEPLEKVSTMVYAVDFGRNINQVQVPSECLDMLSLNFSVLSSL